MFIYLAECCCVFNVKIIFFFKFESTWNYDCKEILEININEHTPAYTHVCV